MYKKLIILMIRIYQEKMIMMTNRNYHKYDNYQKNDNYQVKHDNYE